MSLCIGSSCAGLVNQCGRIVIYAEVRIFGCSGDPTTARRLSRSFRNLTIIMIMIMTMKKTIMMMMTTTTTTVTVMMMMIIFSPFAEVDPPPSLPEKRVRPSSLKNPSLRLKAEIVSEASSGNESSGELRAKRRCRKRVRHQPKGESELSDSETSKSREIREKRRNFVDRRVSDRKTEASKKHKNSNKDDSGASAQFRAKEKNDPCRTGSPSRMTESASKNMTKSEGKANPESTRNSRGAKARDSSSSKQEKTGEEPNRKLSNHVEAEWKDKRDRQATSLRSIKEETLERSGEGEGTSDPEKQEKRSKVKHQSRSADMDLRRKSLTLNLNNSVRTRVEADSPVRESGSVDDDSESCSDAFDDSPLVEMKHFQVNTKQSSRCILYICVAVRRAFPKMRKENKKCVRCINHKFYTKNVICILKRKEHFSV